MWWTLAVALAAPSLLPASASSTGPDEEPAAAGDEGPPSTQEDADDEIVVTTTRRETRLGDNTASVTVIDREQIVESGADTLAELLDMRAGMQVVRSFRGSGLRVRGHNTDHVLILVDGQRVAGRVDGTLDLSRLRTHDVERVEIAPGAGSALYGSDAIGGVVNIVTRTPSEGLTGEVGAALGTFVSGPRRTSYGSIDGATGALDFIDVQGQLGLSRDKLRLMGSASMLLTDPWSSDPDSEGTTGSGFRTFDGTLRSTFTLSRQTSLAVHGHYQFRDTLGTDASATGAIVDRLNRTETGETSLRLTSEVHPAHRLSALLGVGLFRDQFLQDQRGAADLDRVQLTRDLQVQLQVIDSMTLGRHQPTVGVDMFVEDTRTDRVKDGTARRSRAGIFVIDTWRVTQLPRLQLEPSIRVDLDSQFGATASPRLSIRLDPTGPVRIRASVGSGYRAPDFRELYLRFDNPGANYRVEGATSLSPETSIGGSGSVEWQPTSAISLSAEGWFDRIDNLITAVLLSDASATSPSLFTYGNIARAQIAGTAFSLTARSPALSANLNYTFTHTRDVELDIALDGRPSHQGSLSLTGRYRNGFRATTNIAVQGPRGFALATEAPVYLPTSMQLDARLTILPARDVELHLGIDNLLDVGGNALDPLRPRRVYGGVRASFPSRRTP